MLKRISCLALSTVLFLGIIVQQAAALEDSTASADPAVAEDSAVSEQQAAVPEGPSVLLDNTVIETAAPSLYEQTTYVSLRGVATALRPDAVVTWEGDHAAVTAEGLSMTVYPNSKYLVANGRYLYVPKGVYAEDGTIMVPVRVLSQALDAQVEWDAASGNIYLTSGTGAIVSGDQYYNSDDLYWLSHIIFAESGNQPLDGKIGVGNVILNRVNHQLFPNTIYGVIFQRNQFTPASSGSIYKTPNAESVIAAKLCLDGAVVLPSALWFNTSNCNSWASRNKSFVATIGAHSFYS